MRSKSVLYVMIRKRLLLGVLPAVLGLDVAEAMNEDVFVVESSARFRARIVSKSPCVKRSMVTDGVDP